MPTCNTESYFAYRLTISWYHSKAESQISLWAEPSSKTMVIIVRHAYPHATDPPATTFCTTDNITLGWKARGTSLEPLYAYSIFGSVITSGSGHGRIEPYCRANLRIPGNQFYERRASTLARKVPFVASKIILRSTSKNLPTGCG